jgi:hypothetical protein
MSKSQPEVYKVLKEPEKKGCKIAHFSIVANEMYFLPYFLKHYRKLGLEEFYFLVDCSDDGTMEFLLEQRDCGVLKSPFKFKDDFNVKIGNSVLKQRFADICKFLIPKELFMGRWGLIVDADEFMILPSPSRSLPEFIERLERNKLNCCRAPMVDFFPDNLNTIDLFNTDVEPFTICPNYDVVFMDWPDQKVRPIRIIKEMSIRTRLNNKLINDYPTYSKTLKNNNPVMLYKIPLLKWEQNTVVIHAGHISNHLPSNKVQASLAHFKFFPGWKIKVNNALKKQQYALNSAMYRPLAVAANLLGDWPLKGPWTKVMSSMDALSDSDLVFDTLL